MMRSIVSSGKYAELLAGLPLLRCLRLYFEPRTYLWTVASHRLVWPGIKLQKLVWVTSARSAICRIFFPYNMVPATPSKGNVIKRVGLNLASNNTLKVGVGFGDSKPSEHFFDIGA